MRDNKLLGEAIYEYLRYGTLEKGWSETTRIDYEYYLRDFYRFIGNVPVKNIGIGEIRAWRDTLARKTHAYKKGVIISMQTQYCYASAVKYFFDWLQLEGYPVLNPRQIHVSKRALPEKEMKVLTPDEVYLLLEQPEPFTDFGIRDKAILETFYSTGMRLSELVNRRVGDIDLVTSEISIIGKGGKRRVVFLSDRCKKALKKWLDVREQVLARCKIHPGTCDALFTIVRHRNEYSKGPLRPKAIQEMVKRYCLAAGIKLIHPHVLRHTFATHLLQNGVDIFSLKTLLGHAKLDSTAIYLSVTNPQLKEQHQKGMRLNLRHNEEEHIANIKKRMQHKLRHIKMSREVELGSMTN